MIGIKIDCDNYIINEFGDNCFEYDVRSLIMSFDVGERLSLKDKQWDKMLMIIAQQTKIEICLSEGESCIIKKVVNVENTERLAYKNTLKRLVYDVLSEYTNIQLPWGTLTGVRPVKLSVNMLQKGIEDNYIKSYISDMYYVSVEKAELSVKIAKKELKILEDIDYRNECGIYIGIPFCNSRCLYCSFPSNSIENYREYTDVYLDSLFKEIDSVKDKLKQKVNTVYFGGGTPTSLSVNQLDRLLDKVNNSFDMSNVLEFTVEAGRPDSITYNKLKSLKNGGVTRISVNPQTMKQETLDLIGRKHTVKDVKDAFYMARELGHDNINMDIILGLPNESVSDVEYTLKEVCDLSPDNITIHMLAVKRAADLNLNINKSKFIESNISTASKMLNVSCQIMESWGYEPYYLYRQKNIAGNLENIGYSRTGKEGLYNILIMEELQNIVALGAGGMSKFIFDYNEGVRSIERVENIKNLELYISRIDEMIKRKLLYIERIN